MLRPCSCARSPHCERQCRNLISLRQWISHASVVYAQLCLVFISAQEARIAASCISCVSPLSRSQLLSHAHINNLAYTLTQQRSRRLRNIKLSRECLDAVFIVYCGCCSVKSHQAVTSDSSQSFTNCVNGPTAISAMFWAQERGQLIEPNMDATERLKWGATSSCEVHTGASQAPAVELHCNATRRHCTIGRERGRLVAQGSYTQKLLWRHFFVLPVLWNKQIIIFTALTLVMKTVLSGSSSDVSDTLLTVA